MTAPVLDLQNVTVHAGRQCLLAVEHLRVAAGSVVALMGPNGAGKTTLLRTGLGLASPSGGDVTVLGDAVSSLRGAALAGLRRRIGYVPQLPVRSELPLTVREVVAMAGPPGRVVSAVVPRRLAHRGRVDRAARIGRAGGPCLQ